MLYKENIKNISYNSTILMFSTEGATEEENYRKIVWHEE